METITCSKEDLKAGWKMLPAQCACVVRIAHSGYYGSYLNNAEGSVSVRGLTRVPAHGLTRVPTCGGEPPHNWVPTFVEYYYLKKTSVVPACCSELMLSFENWSFQQLKIFRSFSRKFFKKRNRSITNKHSRFLKRNESSFVIMLTLLCYRVRGFYTLS